MVKLVDAYLSRLQSRLAKRLPAIIAQEHISEIEAHLQESISDQTSKGKSEHAATIDALRAMGSDRSVADSLVRARTGIDERPAWRIAWVSVFFLLIYCLFYHGIQTTMVFRLEAYLPWIAGVFVVVFSYACWQSRRLLIVPMSTAVGVVCAAVIAQGLIFGPQEHDRTLSFVNGLIAGGQKQIDAIDVLSRTFRYPDTQNSGQLLAPAPTLFRTGSRLNWTPYIVKSSEVSTNFGLTYVGSDAEARELWKRNGKQYAESLALGMRREKIIQARLKSEKFGIAAAAKLVYSTLLEALGFFAVIMLINAVVLGLNSLHRRALAHLWNPEWIEAARHV